MENKQEDSVAGVLDAWEDEVKDGRSNVGSILRAAGSRAAGPLLFLPALVMISPVGAIPGVPIFLSVLIVLVAGQLIMGRRSIWLPSWVTDRGIPQDKVTSVMDRLRPYAERADNYLGKRLSSLAGQTMSRVIAFLCIGLSILVLPAAPLPGAVVLPGGAIMLLSAGLLTRDGVVVLIGLAATAAAAGSLAYILL